MGVKQKMAIKSHRRGLALCAQYCGWKTTNILLTFQGTAFLKREMKLYLWNFPSTIQFQTVADAQHEPVNQDICDQTMHHKGEQIWRLGGLAAW